MKSSNSRILYTADFFAGIGGIRLGFEAAGFQTAYACDNNLDCKQVHDMNFEKPLLSLADIREISLKPKTIPSFEVLLAGFPCQSFSIAGHRKGFEDAERGALFFDLLNIIQCKRPKAFLLENVKHLKFHNKGATFQTMKSALEDAGYFIKEDILNSAEYGGIPQRRERLYIAGFISRRACNRFSFPGKIPLIRKGIDFIESRTGKKYYYEGKPLYEKIKGKVGNSGIFYQWRRVYLRACDEICPTLTANMGGGGHNVPIISDLKGIRRLTPRECARLQGFPDSFQLPEKYSDFRLYRLIGNSVTVPVIYRIACNIKAALYNIPSTINQIGMDSNFELIHG